MGLRYYRLTVRTSRNSATAFRLDADGDDEAVCKALNLVAKFDSFCADATFEVVRADGTRVGDVPRPRRAVHAA